MARTKATAAKTAKGKAPAKTTKAAPAKKAAAKKAPVKKAAPKKNATKNIPKKTPPTTPAPHNPELAKILEELLIAAVPSIVEKALALMGDDVSAADPPKAEDSDSSDSEDEDQDVHPIAWDDEAKGFTDGEFVFDTNDKAFGKITKPGNVRALQKADKDKLTSQGREFLDLKAAATKTLFKEIQLDREDEEETDGSSSSDDESDIE